MNNKISCWGKKENLSKMKETLIRLFPQAGAAGMRE